MIALAEGLGALGLVGVLWLSVRSRAGRLWRGGCSAVGNGRGGAGLRLVGFAVWESDVEPSFIQAYSRCSGTESTELSIACSFVCGLAFPLPWFFPLNCPFQPLVAPVSRCRWFPPPLCGVGDSWS